MPDGVEAFLSAGVIFFTRGIIYVLRKISLFCGGIASAGYSMKIKLILPRLKVRIRLGGLHKVEQWGIYQEILSVYPDLRCVGKGLEVAAEEIG